MASDLIPTIVSAVATLLVGVVLLVVRQWQRQQKLREHRTAKLERAFLRLEGDLKALWVRIDPHYRPKLESLSDPPESADDSEPPGIA